MPAIVKVQVVAARDLPVMDRSSDSTDCFVEVSTVDREDYRSKLKRCSLKLMVEAY